MKVLRFFIIATVISVSLLFVQTSVFAIGAIPKVSVPKVSVPKISTPKVTTSKPSTSVNSSNSGKTSGSSTQGAGTSGKNSIYANSGSARFSSPNYYTNGYRIDPTTCLVWMWIASSNSYEPVIDEETGQQAIADHGRCKAFIGNSFEEDNK